MTPTFTTHRPLAPLRRAIQDGEMGVAAALRHLHAEIELHLQQSENTIYAEKRDLVGLESYLGRAAAILGIEVGADPDWGSVVGAVADIAEHVHRLEAEVKIQNERQAAAQQRADQSATALARVAAFLGIPSRDAGDILRAIESQIGEPQASR